VTSVTRTSTAGVYYDPFDFGIDDDPYPVWKRLRDEAPLYWNDKYKFFALSRHDDVARALPDWQAYRSGRGTIPDVIFSGMQIPPGIILFEDPPIHDLHRKLLGRVFTRRRMMAVEPLIRRFCASALDELADRSEFDVIADLGVLVPMRTIGYLLGIPESAQAGIRDNTDRQLSLEQAELRQLDEASFRHSNDLISEYIDWRADHPSDDLMTDLLHAEVEENGERRRLTRTEVLTYTNTIAGAGNETTTRLVGFMTQLLAEHPGQLAELAADRSLIPGAVEETLRFEAPSPVQARWVEREVEIHGQVVPGDTVMLLLNGSANRDERHHANPDSFDIHRTEGHLSFGYGLHFCLGAALARLEGQVVLEEMLNRWQHWTVDLSRAERARTASVRGWATLPVQV
jgi:cytochrome P450